jgi:hypothetical protein
VIIYLKKSDYVDGLMKSSECYSCKTESGSDALAKLGHTPGPGCDRPKASVGEFMGHVKECGMVHSGLLLPSGNVAMHRGYATHEAITGNAKITHSYGQLMSHHGVTRLSGPMPNMGIEVHNKTNATVQHARDAADYAEGNGLGVSWSCFGLSHVHHGTDAASMHEHFQHDPFHKSMRTVVLVKSLSDWGNRKYTAPERAKIEALPHDPSHVNSIQRYAMRHIGPADWKAGEDWHHGARQTIEERTGGEPVHHEGVQIGHAPTREHVAQGLAAMSPRVGWGTGAFLADRVHNREMVGDASNAGIGLRNSVKRTRVALRGGGMGSGRSGKKTRALANASLIPTQPHEDHTACDHELPIDVHADRVIHYGRPADHDETGLDGRRHTEHSNAFRVAAARMGKEPHALHFASWTSMRKRQVRGNTGSGKGVRAAMSNEDSRGQPNVLRYAKLWPGQKGEPRLLINSMAVFQPSTWRGRVREGFPLSDSGATLIKMTAIAARGGS